MSKLTQQDMQENASMGGAAEMAAKVTAASVAASIKALLELSKQVEEAERRRSAEQQNIAEQGESLAEHEEGQQEESTEATDFRQTKTGDLVKSIADQHGQDDGSGNLVYRGEKYDFRRTTEPDTGMYRYSVVESGQDHELYVFYDAGHHETYDMTDQRIEVTEALIDEKVNGQEQMTTDQVGDRTSASPQVVQESGDRAKETEPVSVEELAPDDPGPRPPEQVPNEGPVANNNSSEQYPTDLDEELMFGDEPVEDAPEEAEDDLSTNTVVEQNIAFFADELEQQGQEDSAKPAVEEPAVETPPTQSTPKTYKAEKFDIYRTEDNSVHIDDKEGNSLFVANKNLDGTYEIIEDNMSSKDKEIFSKTHERLKKIGKEGGIKGGLERVMKDPSGRNQAKIMGDLAPEGSKAIAFISNELDTVSADWMATQQREYSRSPNGVSVRDTVNNRTLVSSNGDGQITSNLTDNEQVTFSLNYDKQQANMKSKQSQKQHQPNNEIER